MRIRLALLAAIALLAACTASPTSPPNGGPDRQSQYVGPGSAGDQ